MPSVLIPLAPGFEDLEAVTVIDLLRRAQIDVHVAGLEAGPVRGSRGTTVVPDIDLDDAMARDYDMVVLPGGLPGATNLDDDPRVHEILKRTAGAGRFTAAICAAPKVLAHAGLLEGRRATGFPGVLEEAGGGARLESGAVVRDGNVITSRGPGTAMDFALELIQILAGAELRDKVEGALQRPREHLAHIA
jgi:4-methyl-5(b-hydroxyethyl)-thiazole monophosphate biosynthesis